LKFSIKKRIFYFYSKRGGMKWIKPLIVTIALFAVIAGNCFVLPNE
jgi:hypothetical protein